MKHFLKALSVAALMAVCFVAGALAMYLALWYDTFTKLIEFIEKVTV